jgi:hypothetical protein
MSWKPEIQGANETSWTRNGLVFATEKEASDWGFDLLLRWTGATDHRAVEVDEPVNYSYHGGQLVAVKAEAGG